MYCINCGSEIEPGKFCPYCGVETHCDDEGGGFTEKLVPDLPVEPATDPLIPPYQAPMPPREPVPVQPAIPTAIPTRKPDLPQQRRSNGSRPLAAVIAGIIAVVAVAAVVFLVDPLGLRSQTSGEPHATSSPHGSSGSGSDGHSGHSDAGSSGSGLPGGAPSTPDPSTTTPDTEEPETTGELIDAAGYHVNSSDGYYITVPEGFVWSSSDPWVFTEPEHDIEMGVYVEPTSSTLEDAYAWYESRYPDAYRDIFPDSNLFVCSYVEGERVIYEKVYIANGTQTELRIVYPEGTAAGDATVEQVVPEFGLLD